MSFPSGFCAVWGRNGEILDGLRKIGVLMGAGLTPELGVEMSSMVCCISKQ